MEEDSKARTTSESADSSRKKEAIEVLRLTARMKKATTSLQLDSEEEASKGSSFLEDDLSVHPGDLDLQLSDYDSDAQEVSSGEFDARHVKKYATPESFKHVLWNTARPSAGAMQICLEIIKEELLGQIAGVPAEFKDLPEQLISVMYKEAWKDIHDTITFINRMHEQLGKYDDNKEEGNRIAMSKPLRMMKLNQLLIFLSPRTGEHKRPVRLRDNYPEPNRRVPQMGLSLSLPQKQEGTRRECNP